MIKTFSCHETKALFSGRPAPHFLPFVIRAERKLQMLDAASALNDLSAPLDRQLCTNDPAAPRACILPIDQQRHIVFRYDHGDIHDVAIVSAEVRNV